MREDISPEIAGLGTEAVASILEDVRRALLGVVPRWFSGAEIDDMTQEALIKVLQYRASLSAEQSISRLYLRKAVYSVVVENIRRVRLRKEMRKVSDESEEKDLLAVGSTKEVDIREALLQLTAGDRRLVTLHLLGVPLSQAAEEMNVTVSAIRIATSRALGRLRTIIDVQLKSEAP